MRWGYNDKTYFFSGDYLLSRSVFVSGRSVSVVTNLPTSTNIEAFVTSFHFLTISAALLKLTDFHRIDLVIDCDCVCCRNNVLEV